MKKRFRAATVGALLLGLSLVSCGKNDDGGSSSDNGGGAQSQGSGAKAQSVKDISKLEGSQVEAALSAATIDGKPMTVSISTEQLTPQTKEFLASAAQMSQQQDAQQCQALSFSPYSGSDVSEDLRYAVTAVNADGSLSISVNGFKSLDVPDLVSNVSKTFDSTCKEFDMDMGQLGLVHVTSDTSDVSVSGVKTAYYQHTTSTTSQQGEAKDQEPKQSSTLMMAGKGVGIAVDDFSGAYSSDQMVSVGEEIITALTSS